MARRPEEWSIRLYILHPANHHPASLESGLSARSTQAHVPWQSQWRVRFDDRPPKPKPQRATTKKPGNSSAVQNERSKKRTVKFPSPTHPSTILQKGNSDPFNAAAVPIDPQAHDVLLFYRDCLIPALHALESNSTPTVQGMRSWQESVSALHEESAAYSFLARSALVMSAADPPESKLALQAMAWKVKASAILRADLAHGGSQDERQIHRSICYLLITELMARNTAGAAVHAKMLSSLMRQYQKTRPLDLRFLYRAIYNDTQRASMSLSRPAFDYEIWIPEQFGPIWQSARSHLPPLQPTVANGVDPSIEDEKLRAIFVLFRELLEWFVMITIDPSKANTLTWPFLTSRTTTGQARLVDYYLDQMSIVKSLDDVRCHTPAKVHASLAAQDSAWISACTALAALYWTRAISKNENIAVGRTSTGPVGTIYEAGPTILTKIRSALTASDESLESKHNKARLWASYVGALADQSNTQGRLDADKSWFNIRFARQAKAMGLFTWNEVKENLTGFLYADHMKPHGSQWFFKAMR
jgi:hypothetical protein